MPFLTQEIVGKKEQNQGRQIDKYMLSTLLLLVERKFQMN